MATVRHALKRKHVYLPDHRRRMTSLSYMKDIISGKKKFYFSNKINFVDVPRYDELNPENVI